MCSCTGSASSFAIVASAAAAHAGCPLKVPANMTGCPGFVLNSSIRSARPPIAPIG